LSHFICRVCQEVFRSPVQCKAGHTFCKICLLRCKDCPLCRGSIDLRPTVNRVAEESIEGFNVKCKRYNNDADNGGKCNWIGKLTQLENHYLKECCVECVACKIKVLRKDYKYHVNTCIVVCKHCNLNVLHKMLNNHDIYECLEKPVKCSNEGCLVSNIARKELQNHKLNDCLFQPIKCPFFTSGCGEGCDGFVLRNKFNEHITNTAAIVSSCKKTTELENKVLVLSTSKQNRSFVLKLINIANEEFFPKEEVLLKKWIELYNNNSLRNKQSIENLFKDIVVEKKRKLNNNEEKLQIANTIIFEFKIPKNFKKNDVFDAYSHTKVLHQEIKGHIFFDFIENSEFFGIYIYLENFNNEAKWRFTLLNFNGTKNVSKSSTKNWKDVLSDEATGCDEFIKFDDLINEKFLFEEYYVARIIAKIDLEIV
jgi:hypothetical protein